MVKISKNCHRGTPVDSTKELLILALNHKSVYCRKYGVKPASVIVNMQFKGVAQMIEKLQFYHVVKA